MQTRTDQELRAIAAELIRDMNKITGITTADQARMLGLHKANVAACINQGRVENLGWQSIGRLLRTYGFESSAGEIHIRDSEACPIFASRPFTDEIKNALTNVVSRLRSFGMTCSFYQIVVDYQKFGKYEFAGVLLAKHGDKRWACVTLSSDSKEYLTPCFDELSCLPGEHKLKMDKELFESWCDSPPHRSEVMSFYEKSTPY
jgi:hypothetical protein